VATESTKTDKSEKSKPILLDQTDKEKPNYKWLIAFGIFAGIALFMVLFLHPRQQNGTANPLAAEQEENSRSAASNRSTQSLSPPINNDCLDRDDHSRELHHEQADSEFNEFFEPGCGTLIHLSKPKTGEWRLQPAGIDRTVHRPVYIKEPGRPYVGPYDLWQDIEVKFNDPTTFYIEPANTGLKIHFWIDGPEKK
jgi:hypothetical protein